MGCARGRERSAQVAGGVVDQECGEWGREGLSGDDEVAFVFAGGGVEDDEELTGAEGFDAVGDCVEFESGRRVSAVHRGGWC